MAIFLTRIVHKNIKHLSIGSKTICPTLNAHELKLCAYLSSKEIAQLENISVQGMEISRCRLRKKLKIPTETNPFDFLLGIHLPGQEQHVNGFAGHV